MDCSVLSVCARPIKRYHALLIDGLIFGILILPVMIYSYVARLIQNEQYMIVFYLFLYKVVVYVLFDVIIPYVQQGQTIGRKVVHTRLISQSGNCAQLLSYIKRASIFIILAILGDVFLLGTLAYTIATLITVASIILIFTDEYRRTIFDLIGGTMVVQDISYYIEEEA